MPLKPFFVIGLDVVGEIDHTHLRGCHKITVNPVDTDTIRHGEWYSILRGELTDAEG